MNRFNKFSPLIYVLVLLSVLFFIQKDSQAQVPTLSVTYQEYLPPGQNTLAISAALGPFNQQMINGFYPNVKTVAYLALGQYQGMLNTSSIPFSGWTQIVLAPEQQTIDLSAYNVTARSRIPFYIALVTSNWQLLALSEEKYVTTGMRLSVHAENRIATVWAASEEPVINNVFNAVIPFALDQYQGKKIVLRSSDGRLIPAQQSPWAFYPTNNNDVRQLRVSFIDTFRQAGEKLYEVYLEDAGNIDELSCAISPKAMDFFQNASLTYRIVGMRPGEEYSARFTDLNFIISTPQNVYMERKETGPIAYEVMLSKPLTPSGTGGENNHVPTAGVVKVYMKYVCGDDTVSVNTVYGNGTINIDENRNVIASEGEIILRNFLLEITKSTGPVHLAKELFSFPAHSENGQSSPMSNLPVYRYGSQTTSGNMVSLNLFPQAAAHILREGSYVHLGGDLVIGADNSSSSVARANKLSRISNFATVVNVASRRTDNSWLQFEALPGSGIPDLSALTAPQKLTMLNTVIDSLHPLTLSGSGVWTQRSPNLSIPSALNTRAWGECPYNYYGSASGSETGGPGILIMDPMLSPAPNLNGTGINGLTYLKLMRLKSQAQMARDTYDAAFDAVTSAPTTYEWFLQKLGARSPNPNVANRNFNIDFARIYVPYESTRETQFPHYRVSRDLTLQNRWLGQDAYRNQVPYLPQLEGIPNQIAGFSSTNNQHAFRNWNVTAAALPLIAEHYMRDYLVNIAETVKLASIWDVRDQNDINGAHLRTALFNAQNAPGMAKALDRTLEPFVFLAQQAFLKGSSSVNNPIFINEILSILRDTLQISMINSHGILARDYYYQQENGNNLFPYISSFADRIRAYYGLSANSQIELTNVIQNYQNYLVTAYVMSLMRAVEYSDNPVVQNISVSLKDILKTMATRGIDINHGTVTIAEDGNLGIHYYTPTAVRVTTNGEARTINFNPSVSYNHRYFESEYLPRQGGTWEHYPQMASPLSIWLDRDVRDHLMTPFSYNGRTYEYFPTITDLGMAIADKKVVLLWTQQYLAAFGGSGGGPSGQSSSGNRGNFPGGVVIPASDVTEEEESAEEVSAKADKVETAGTKVEMAE